MTDLPPRYNDKQLNTLRLLALHGEGLSEACANYKKAIDGVIALHDEYIKDPTKRSINLAYQGALLNLESAKAAIQEFRDMSYESQINEWLP
jgi:hypothetical protein